MMCIKLSRWLWWCHCNQILQICQKCCKKRMTLCQVSLYLDEIFTNLTDIKFWLVTSFTPVIYKGKTKNIYAEALFSSP